MGKVDTTWLEVNIEQVRPITYGVQYLIYNKAYLLTRVSNRALRDNYIGLAIAHFVGIAYCPLFSTGGWVGPP